MKTRKYCFFCPLHWFWGLKTITLIYLMKQYILRHYIYTSRDQRLLFIVTIVWLVFMPCHTESLTHFWSPDSCTLQRCYLWKRRLYVFKIPESKKFVQVFCNIWKEAGKVLLIQYYVFLISYRSNCSITLLLMILWCDWKWRRQCFHSVPLLENRWCEPQWAIRTWKWDHDWAA